MLVLSRRNQERIFIGDDIVIQVVYIDRGKVRLGITAPKDVPVHREDDGLRRVAKQSLATSPST